MPNWWHSRAQIFVTTKGYGHLVLTTKILLWPSLRPSYSHLVQMTTLSLIVLICSGTSAKIGKINRISMAPEHGWHSQIDKWLWHAQFEKWLPRGYPVVGTSSHFDQVVIAAIVCNALRGEEGGVHLGQEITPSASLRALDIPSNYKLAPQDLSMYFIPSHLNASFVSKIFS